MQMSQPWLRQQSATLSTKMLFEVLPTFHSLPRRQLGCCIFVIIGRGGTGLPDFVDWFY